MAGWWYGADKPHLGYVALVRGGMTEQARLVKTVKVSMPIAKWDGDQTVCFPPGKNLGGTAHQWMWGGT